MSQVAASEELGFAAAAFRALFTELRSRFFEREEVLRQLQLALLSREHLLLVGPPGTGKSALSESALTAIRDADTGAPSLFSRQLTESTVQTDLIGPVDFKVLTETGRTEYLTEDGMLGARFAFLDEVFDGRDMLLRAILNVLHERELKHGRRVTVGRVQTAVLTSNRFLSEVIARSPELLVAFADRVAFVAYVPKGFAHPRSRASMLEQAMGGQRPRLKAQLSSAALEVLQAAADAVEVPSDVAAALELLVEGLERRLQARSSELVGYRPTRLFSQRSLVKAQGVLRAVVLHEILWRAPQRAPVARLEDLEGLRATLILGGPRAQDLESLCQKATDPRERAQLEIVRLERDAFDEALAEALAAVAHAETHEARALGLTALTEAARALVEPVDPAALVHVLDGLAESLHPGPRHPRNRPPLASAAREALLSLRHLLLRELRPGSAPTGDLTLEALLRGLSLVTGVDELANEVSALAEVGRAWLEQRMQLCVTGLDARALEGALGFSELGALAQRLTADVSELDRLGTELGRLAGVDAMGSRDLHARLGKTLRRWVRRAFSDALEDEGEEKALESFRLQEPLLIALDPSFGDLREVLIAPVIRQRAERELAALEDGRIAAISRCVRGAVGAHVREGLSLGPLMVTLAPWIRERLERRATLLEARMLTRAPPPSSTLFDASLYGEYVNHFAGVIADGDCGELEELTRLLVEAGAEDVVTPALRRRLQEQELHALEAREGFLSHWFEQLLQALPAPSKVTSAKEAQLALDRLVKSHFPLLTLREGEFLRLSTSAARLRDARVPDDDRAEALHLRVERLQRALERYGEGLLSHLER